MTKNLFPLAIVALLCACQTPLTLQQEQAARVALKPKPSVNGVNGAVQAIPITTSTRFAARCPYCDQVCFSKSCLPSGGSAAMQEWRITYTCPSCGMFFTDSRQQPLSAVHSIRLPVGQ